MSHSPTSLYGAAPAQRRSLVRVLETTGASLIGGFFLIIADIIFNEERAVTTQIAGLLGKHVSADLNNTRTELFAFLTILGLGLGLCFVFQPKTRIKAFGMGSSVIAVLVGMNIGASVLSRAEGAELTLSGSALIALEKPRAFGPLGVGTKITGKSAAQIIEVPLSGPITIDCAGDDLVLGDERYCVVPAGQLPAGLAGRISTQSPVWIRR